MYERMHGFTYFVENMDEFEEMCGIGRKNEEKLEAEGGILIVLVVRHYNAGY